MADLATNIATNIMEDILEMVGEDVESKVVDTIQLSEDNIATTTEDVEDEDADYDENQALNSSLDALDSIDIDNNNIEKEKAKTIEDIEDKETITEETVDINCCYSWFDLFNDAYGSWGRLSSSLNKPSNDTNDDKTNNNPLNETNDDETNNKPLNETNDDETNNKPLNKTNDDETPNKTRMCGHMFQVTGCLVCKNFGPDDFTGNVTEIEKESNDVNYGPLDDESEAKKLDEKSGMELDLNEEVCDDTDELELVEDLTSIDTGAIDEDIYESVVTNDEFDMDNAFIEEEASEGDDDENDPIVKTAKTTRNESRIGSIDSLAKEEKIPRRKSERLALKRKISEQKAQDEGEKKKYFKENK